MRLLIRWIPALAVVLGFPASVQGHPYDQVVRGSVSIDYLLNPDGKISGLEGTVETTASVCGISRPVLIRASLRSGQFGRYWTNTHIFGWELVDVTEPGSYRARIRPVVRFDRVKGERVSILCKGDFSRRLVVADPDAAPNIDGGRR